jgi:hypothetical protein
MSSRLEFVTLALAPGANRRALCRARGLSPETACGSAARITAWTAKLSTLPAPGYFATSSLVAGSATLLPSL